MVYWSQKHVVGEKIYQLKVVIIRRHKHKGKILEIIGTKFLVKVAKWILEAAASERRWLDPSATNKRGNWESFFPTNHLG